jgi:hypothetical protein
VTTAGSTSKSAWSGAEAKTNRPLCRGYDGARPAISISCGFVCILHLIRRVARAGCWKIRHDRILLASGQVL